MKKPKHNHSFIKFVRRECKRYGVKLTLKHVKRLPQGNEGETCGGYFIEDPLEIAVATKILYVDFLSILVHEYAHVTQWIDKSPFCVGYRNYDSWDIMDRWIGGEEFTRTTVHKSIDAVRDCELDCDRRAVMLIKKHKIPVNIERYCQKASAYMYLHNFIKKSRKWEYKKMPSQISAITNKMPTNLDGDYIVTPHAVTQLFKKYLRLRKLKKSK